MKIKKGELVIITGVMIVLNIWLLYSINQKNRVIEEFENRKDLNNWKFETVDSTLLYLSHHDVVLSNDPLRLNVFFSDQGCQSCIEDEVNLINKFNAEHPNLLNVYLLTAKAPTYLSRMFEANFDYKVIDPRINVFDGDFEFVNPIAVLVDSLGLVHRLHKAEVANSSKSEEFYRQMRKFFSDCNSHPEHGR